MSHCRWVVIAEQCYQDLTRKLENNDEKMEVDSPESGTKTLEPPSAESVDVPPPSPSATPAEPSAPDDVTEDEPNIQTHPTNDESSNESAQNKWVQDLPPAYKEPAETFINTLEKAGGFEITESGFIQLDGDVLPYHISDFLRTTQVPFNKNPLPYIVQEWLRKKNISSFQNTQLQLAPKWESIVHWRKYTTHRRKAHTEARKRFTKEPAN